MNAADRSDPVRQGRRGTAAGPPVPMSPTEHHDLVVAARAELAAAHAAYDDALDRRATMAELREFDADVARAASNFGNVEALARRSHTATSHPGASTF